MSQDVTQWLDEIKQLRAQVATLQQERDGAFSESATWRDRLDAEMKLRVRETNLLRQQIDTLEAAQRRLEGGNRVLGVSSASGVDAKAIQPSQSSEDTRNAADSPAQRARAQRLQDALASLETLEDLRQYATEIAQERDRLRQALETERQAHAETRENLSIALGDTIDLLAYRSDSNLSNPDAPQSDASKP